MRIQKGIKRSTKQFIVVAIICIVVIGSAAIFTALVVTGQIRDEYEELLQEAYDDMTMNQRNVYVSILDIRQGETIQEENVERKTVYSSQPAEYYISSEDIGKAALINIAAGTQIINSMVTEKIVSDKLRETEYKVISISPNISEDDTVDVRISFPNGESYVVLSKKEIKGLLPDTASILLWLEEDELLRMSAAIVDAGLYLGSVLSVTKYVEPHIQEASVITYTPSLTILSLIENNPNIVEHCSLELNKQLRKGLENRLALSMDMDVSSISWDLDPNVLAGAMKTSAENKETNTSNRERPSQYSSNQYDSKDQDEANDNAREDNGKEYDAKEDDAGGDNDRGDGARDDARDDAEADTTDTKEKDAQVYELGASDYLYFVEEELAKEGDIEYGE